MIEYANVVLGSRFEWGRTDCVSIVRFGLHAAYGEDPWRGAWYDSRQGALAFRNAVGEMPEYLKRNGWVERKLDEMQPADIVIEPMRSITGDPYSGLAITHGRWLSSSEKSGVRMYDITDAVGAAYIMRPDIG